MADDAAAAPADTAVVEPIEVILALDQGTQSTRVWVFDTKCRPLASHQVALPQIYPQAGWAEHDPFEIWRTAQEVLEGALQSAQAEHGPVKPLAIGITNQRETTLVWRRSTGIPLYNAVVWLDTRTSEICERLTAQIGDRDALRPSTGLPLSTYFSGLKWLWLLENVPELAEAVADEDACMGTVDSWLLWCLTGGAEGGVHVTDVTNASRTMLLDLQSLEWHPPALELFQVPLHVLPRLVSNAEVYGHCALPGILNGVPLSGCLGDQQAALLGQRCSPGEAKNTYGTGCFLLLNTGPGAPIQSASGLLTTLAHRLGPDVEACYALEGGVAVAGLGISWLQNGLGVLSSAAESEEIANSVPDTSGCYLVPAFGGLLAPRWRPDARGALVGLTAGTTRAHVVRAMLEAIAFQTREVLDAMRRDLWQKAAGAGRMASGLAGSLVVDGGGCVNNLLMQLQADLMQVDVLRPQFRESTSLGAALAAGLGIGLWTEEQVFTRGDESAYDRFEPSITREDCERRFRCWNKAVERSLGLAELATADFANDPDPVLAGNSSAQLGLPGSFSWLQTTGSVPTMLTQAGGSAQLQGGGVSGAGLAHAATDGVGLVHGGMSAAVLTNANEETPVLAYQGSQSVPQLVFGGSSAQLLTAVAGSIGSRPCSRRSSAIGLRPVTEGTDSSTGDISSGAATPELTHHERRKSQGSAGEQAASRPPRSHSKSRLSPQS